MTPDSLNDDPRTLSMGQAKARLEQILLDVVASHVPWTITRDGEPVAVILATEDYADLKGELAALARDLEIT